jgi:hypothetical protein
LASLWARSSWLGSWVRISPPSTHRDRPGLYRATYHRLTLRWPHPCRGPLPMPPPPGPGGVARYSDRGPRPGAPTRSAKCPPVRVRPTKLGTRAGRTADSWRTVSGQLDSCAKHAGQPHSHRVGACGQLARRLAELSATVR